MTSLIACLFAKVTIHFEFDHFATAVSLRLNSFRHRLKVNFNATERQIPTLSRGLQSRLMAASHRIRLRLTIRLMANGSLHTSSVSRIRVNFLGFDRLPPYLKLFHFFFGFGFDWLPAYLKLFKVSWIAGVGVLAACGMTAVSHKPDRKP